MHTPHTPEEVVKLRRSYQPVLDNPAYGLGQKDMARHVLALGDSVDELYRRIAELRAGLARCSCWNRGAAGRASEEVTTCETLKKSLAGLKEEPCPPCQARALLATGQTEAGDAG